MCNIDNQIFIHLGCPCINFASVLSVDCYCLHLAKLNISHVVKKIDWVTFWSVTFGMVKCEGEYSFSANTFITIVIGEKMSTNPT